MVSTTSFVRGGSRGALLASTALFAILVGANPASAQFVYKPNSNNDEITIIDMNTGNSAGSVPTGFPRGVAVRGDQSLIYVSNSYDNTVSVIDTRTNAVIQIIPVAGGPDGVALSPDNTRLYVTNGQSNSVSIIDTASNTVVGVVPVGSTPIHVVVSPDGGRAYVTNVIASSVSVIDTQSLTLIATVAVAGGPLGVAISPDGRRVYVAGQSGTVSVIDSGTNTVVGNIPIPFARQVVLSQDGSRAYVSGSTGLSVIDTATNAVIETFTTAMGSSGLVLSHDGKRVYLSNSDNTFSVVDLTTGVIQPLFSEPFSWSMSTCGNGNALLAAGRTFSAGQGNALGCTGTSAVFTGGTLRFINTGISSAQPIILMSQGGIIDTNGVDATLNGPISGAGSLTKIGAGTLTLGSAGTYTGATFVGAGTLQAGAANVFSPFSAYTVASGAVLDLNGLNQTIGSLAGAGRVTLGSGTLTTGADNASTSYSGEISGSGGLIKQGTGTFILSSANTYTGGTTINAGVLTLSGAGTLGDTANATAVNGATAVLDLGGTSQTQNGGVSLQNGGTIRNGSLTGALTSSGGVINRLGGSASVAVSGGTTQMLGTNTYTGATAVNAGVLEVAAGGSIVSDVTVNGGRFVSNGSSLGTMTVNTGGMLGGNGIVGTTAIDGGTLSPGNSIGTLTIQGSLSLTAASTYRVEVDPAASDRTNITGTATLGGATVAAIYAPGAYVTRQYTILNAAGGVSGTFASLVNTNLPANFAPSLSYDTNNAYLNLTLNFVPPDPEPPTSPDYGNGLNLNQSSVANALVNSFNTAGGIPLAFGALTPQGLTQVSGEAATGTQQATFNMMSQFLGAMLDPFAAGRGETGQGGAMPYADEALAYASPRQGRNASEREAYNAVYKAPPRIADAFNRWSVWASGFGGGQTTAGNASVGSADTTVRIYGAVAGADYRLSPDTTIGFALGGAGSNYGFAKGLGSGRSEAFQAGIYGRHAIGAAYVAAALAYGWQDITTDRSVFLNRYRARFDANALSGRIESGYRFAWQSMGQDLGLTPYVAGQFTTLFLPGYAEEVVAGGNLFALSYQSKDVTASRSELGLRADTSFALNDARVTLRGRAAWAHNFDTSRSVSVNFQSLPASAFVVSGATPARDAALVSAGAEMAWRSGFALAASFDGEFSRNVESYAGRGTVRYRW
jgi:YVTN family beta-propeller protein/autotransporter-associated beta strand protein